MYPLNAILLGLNAETTEHMRKELAACRVHVEGELADVSAANHRLQHQGDSPRLLIVQGSALPMEETLRELRSAFTAWPILALAPPNANSEKLLAINRAGADQIIATPINSADFSDAIRLIALRHHAVERPPLTVVVSGAVPGVGSTMISANLAAEFAQGYGVRTMLVETALQMGVLAVNLDVQPKVTFGDLLADSDNLDVKDLQKALVHIPVGFDLLAAPPDVVPAAIHTVEAVRKVLTLARQLADVVVVDVPCQYDDHYFETLWAADQVVLVCDQSLPAIRTTRMILDAIGRAHTVKHVHIVLNKFDLSIPVLTSDKVAHALGGVEVLKIPNDYSAVMTAASEGQLLRVANKHSPVVAAIQELAAHIMGQPHLEVDRKRMIMAWLRKAVCSLRDRIPPRALISQAGAAHGN